MDNAKWIQRFYEAQFEGMLQKGKVTVLFGSRQVGKTSLVKRNQIYNTVFQ